MKLNEFLYKKNLSHLSRPFAPFLGSILMFHRVVAPDGKSRLPENQLYEITPETLRSTIRFFRERDYDFISMDDLIERIGQKRGSRRFVTFTFDDGYSDTLSTAFPILKEEDIPFCVYITTDFPDRKAAFWWNMLEDALITHDHLTFHLDGKSHTIACATMEEKSEAFTAICRLVLKADCGITAAWRALFEPLGIDRQSYSNDLAMSWDQIRQLGQDPLVTIGAHTCSHPSLASLTEEEARHEMQKSQEIIQDQTSLIVRHFSYPYGSPQDVTDREARLSAEIGFKTAVTTETGNVYPYHHRRMMLLPRVHVPEINSRQTLTLVSDGCIAQTFIRS